MQVLEHGDEVWPFGHVKQVPDVLDADWYKPGLQHAQVEEDTYFPDGQLRVFEHPPLLVLNCPAGQT